MSDFSLTFGQANPLQCAIEFTPGATLMTVFRASDPAALLGEIAARALTHISIGCLDWDGRLRAKHYSSASLNAALATGMAMTTTIFAQDIADTPIALGPFEDAAGGYPDGHLQLDVTSSRDAPFEAGGAGLLLFGEFKPPYDAFCPRAQLRAELARLAAFGFEVQGGYELEFRLLDESVMSLTRKSAAELAFAPAFERMYGWVDQVASSAFVHALEQWAARMDVPIAAVHHEFKGMVELSLAKAHGLAIADNALLARSLAAILAAREQRLACFMPRVAPGMQSAGAHLNLSLWRHGENVFFTEPGVRAAFIAGLQAAVPGLFVLCAPTINAYKRFAPDSIAPARNTWGINNKTVAYRVVDDDAAHARLEIRVPGADVNPYLVLTAMLAAGRRGIERNLTPTAPCAADAAEVSAPAAAPFPRDLAAATAAWRASAMASSVFGDAFVDAYARSREWQLQRFAQAVTDWELQHYARSL